MFIKFRTNAIEQYNEWALTDKKKFKKIIKLISEIKRTPYTGTGKPEPVKRVRFIEPNTFCVTIQQLFFIPLY